MYTSSMRAHRALSRAEEQTLRPRRRFSFRATEPEPEPEPEVPVAPIGPGQWVDEGRTDEVVDLLNPRPAVTVDTKRLRRALAFGFAGGDTTDTLRRALRRAPVAASDWEPSCFDEGLFVPDLLRTCMMIRIDGFEPQVDPVYLTRLLTQPPCDQEVVTFRREVLSELASDQALRSHFQSTYRALYALRELFEPEDRVLELDDSGHRLELLGAIRTTISTMASGFDACDSGLRRIDRFAARAIQTEGYRQLLELLDYDNHLAGVDLKLRIGADGRVRRFEILAVSENRTNRFYQSPLGRLLTRISLLFRGYLFSEGELVNRWVDSVFDGVVELLPPLIQLLGEMEFYLAALSFKDLSEAKGLEVCFAELEPSGERVIEGLFNPLLFGQDITPVPCDLRADRWEMITVVTGPNSGGKTRLLQAVAIAQMLSQAGMYTPAARASLGRASGLFVSLIQEVRADQREGRLGTELIRIRDLFERARPGFLIILDELCSGTNPSEGEEIFRLVLSLLGELSPCVFITTHFLQFAARLEAEQEKREGLSFLQVELDDHECPTFHFVDGVAETSLANQTAARLGVTREELLALVRRNCGAPGERCLRSTPERSPTE